MHFLSLRNFSILFLLICLTKHSYSQLFFTKGYVILASGDTLTGEIRERTNQLLELRTDTDKLIHEYTPEQLIGYQSADNKRLTVKLTEDGRETSYFMRRQLEGYVSLYSLFKPEGRLTHAIRLPDQTFVPLRGNLTLLMLTRHLTECHDAAFTRLLNSQTAYFSTGQLDRIISRYNSCVRPNQLISKPKRKFQYEAGVLLGAVQNSWNYADADTKKDPYWNPNGVYSPTYTGTIGGFFTIAPRKRLSGSIEILFTHYNGTRTVSINNPFDATDARSRVYSFSESYFAAPITGRYVFSNGSTRWYIKGGIVPTYATSIKGSSSGSYSQTTINDLEIPMRSTVGLGYLAGLGADIRLGEKRHLYIEARTMPHLVMYRVTHLANSRSLQLTVSMPLIER